jgi:hypothetical protein
MIAEVKTDQGRSMKLTRRELLAASSTLAWSARSLSQSSLQPKSRFGINLSGPTADWNTEQAFVNVFRLSRPWVSQREGAEWGGGPQLDLDQHGWVKRLEPGCAAETILCNVADGHYPSGRYTVFYDGAGAIGLRGAANVASSEPGRIVIDVDSSRGYIGLRVEETMAGDYVRNIRVMMPGFDAQGDRDTFRPDFLQRWRGVACLRFMDWMSTNNSEVVHWSDRSTTNHATYAELGVPLETMIQLANVLEADAWFCMPHSADDDYVRNFALTVSAELNSNRRVWIEFSNEVWNAGFRQHHDAAARGKQLGFTGESWEIARRYAAYRSQQIFNIWKSELGRDSRLVCVLPSQAASVRVSEQVLGFRDAFRSADVLAIAPYITCNIGRSGAEGLTTTIVERWDVEQILDYMERTALPEAIDAIARQKAVADRYGLKLAAYEAGQHMVGVNGVENNDIVTSLLHAANAHPRMGEIYRRYYDAWTELGGDLLCAYSSVDGWSKWGSWGLMQYPDDDPTLSPKYRASVDWARRRGQSMAPL